MALTLIWGASFLWIKIAVQDIGPTSLVAFRLVLGILGLLVLLAVRRPQTPRDGRTWTSLAVLGLINTALPWFLISWAEQTIDSALATVLNSAVPLFTILIAHFFLRDDRITVKRVVGLLLGFAGVMVLVGRGGESHGPGGSVVGSLAMLGATFLYAVSAVFARRRLSHISALIQAFYSMLVATVLWWVMFWISDEPLRISGTAMTWAALAWLGVLGAGLASYLYYYLLHAIGPTRSSLVTYTIPVVGVSLGVIVLKERLDLNLIAGTILIVSGVSVVNR